MPTALPAPNRTERKVPSPRSEAAPSVALTSARAPASPAAAGLLAPAVPLPLALPSGPFTSGDGGRRAGVASAE